jgi:GntR family transcriptional regulator
VIPFRLAFQPGIPVHEQVSFAARKAMMAGQLRPGDPFPSVRALSKALKINPNTAHKVVAQLTAEGLLEVRPGIGTVVAEPPAFTRAERARLLGREVEQLTVEAKRLGVSLGELQEALAEHWRKLGNREAREESRYGGQSGAAH